MKIIIFLALIFLAILLGFAITIDPGYVLISYNHWTAEMPLWFTVITIILIFIVLHYCLRFWKFIININEHLHIRKIKKHFHKQRPLTDSGFLALIEENWYKLAELLPQLKKQRVFQNTTYRQLEINIYFNLLKQQVNLNKLQQTWNNIHRSLRNDHKLVASYCQKLLEFHQDNEAAKILQKQLDSNGNARLIELYAKTNINNHNKQLTKLESYLKTRRDEPVLLLAMGRIAAKCKLWGKAEEYLQMYCKAGGDPANTYAILGYIYSHHNETEKALMAYQKIIF